jgi:hypothetical protein
MCVDILRYMCPVTDVSGRRVELVLWHALFEYRTEFMASEMAGRVYVSTRV